MIRPDLDTIHIEAGVYRRLVEHLMQERTDVRDSELMRVAGFCRHSLAQWYREAAEARGITMSEEEARQAVYAMPWQPDDVAQDRSAPLPPEGGRC